MPPVAQVLAEKSASDLPELEIQKLLDRDPYLTDHQAEIKRRFSLFRQYVEDIESREGGIEKMALGHRTFGCQLLNNGDIKWTEWAPAARSLHLMGEFNNWSRVSHEFTQLDYGRWELVLPARQDKKPQLEHGDKVKLLVNGQVRISPWASYVVQPSKEKQHSQGTAFSQHFWNPTQKYKMKNKRCLTVLVFIVLSDKCCSLQASQTRQSEDIRVPCWYFLLGREGKHLQRLHGQRAAPDSGPGLQHHPADGRHGTRLLRQLRIPGHQLLRSLLQVSWIGDDHTDER